MNKDLPAMPDDHLPKKAGEFVLYQTEDGQTRIEVRVEHETIWLTQKTMAELFQKDVRTIPANCINAYSLVAPPADIAARFGDIADSMFSQMKSNDEEASELTNACDRLLPRLLSGKMSVSQEVT
jgi:hypothetical protein